LIGVNGAVVWSAQYSAFGKADVEVETVVNSLRFPGQYYDEETGLFYNYHRYYDPKIGRYLKEDSLNLGAINGSELIIHELYEIFINQKTRLYGNQIGVDRAIGNWLKVLLFRDLIYSPLRLNYYFYSNSNPTNNMDPLGYWFGIGLCEGICGFMSALVCSYIGAAVGVLAEVSVLGLSAGTVGFIAGIAAGTACSMLAIIACKDACPEDIDKKEVCPEPVPTLRPIEPPVSSKPQIFGSNEKRLSFTVKCPDGSKITLETAEDMSAEMIHHNATMLCIDLGKY
jgi:RHS repeat-associated protein